MPQAQPTSIAVTEIACTSPLEPWRRSPHRYGYTPGTNLRGNHERVHYNIAQLYATIFRIPAAVWPVRSHPIDDRGFP
jgi:hypothetical protein